MAASAVRRWADPPETARASPWHSGRPGTEVTPSPDPDNLRSLVVSGDHLARAGLAALLDGLAGCSVVGQDAGDAGVEAALDLYRPDVVVWDLGWDPAAAIDQLRSLGAGGPPVVALLEDGARGAEVLDSGARGLLPRDVDPETLLTALVAVHKGLVVVDPRLSSALPQAGGWPLAGSSVDLTPREREVLQLVAEGMPNKSIAQKLGISEHTVKFHVNAILGKLDARSRTEAVTRAARMGLILL